MKRSLLIAAFAVFILSGCAQKQLIVNGLICPEGHTDELIKADLTECRYYDLKAATEASKAPISIECKTCLERKGYKIEK